MLNIPSSRRRVPVRLTEIPVAERRKAARRAARAEVEALRVLELHVAAERPSDTVYWVAA